MSELEQARAIINNTDREIAALFCKRMEAVGTIAAYKRDHGLPILDEARERAVISHNMSTLPSEALRPYYTVFLQNVMAVSKRYQHDLLAADACPALRTTGLGYDIVLARDSIRHASQHLNLQRKVLVVTDDGVPTAYADLIAAQCRDPFVICIPQGEGSKSFDTLQLLLGRMLDSGFTRSDCVAAVGGGVVGDLAGFAASMYMRGVDFYNIPTTLLAQVDSSIGGKTAIDFAGLKNIVGAFYPPKAVLIDPSVLDTLPPRQLAAGQAEIVKMALTSDRELFEQLESGFSSLPLDEIIARALRIKADVVAQDEKEAGLRRVLNFGHTIGHAIEAVRPDLLHGECVALGMLPLCAPDVRCRLIRVLEQLGLPTSCRADESRLLDALLHDKKADGTHITVTEVHEAGHFVMRSVTLAELQALLPVILKGAEDA